MAVLLFCGFIMSGQAIAAPGASLTGLVQAIAAPGASSVDLVQTIAAPGTPSAGLVQASAMSGTPSANLVRPAAPPAESPTGPVTMEAEYGFDNMAKGGRYLPLTVTIGNNQETAIDGTLIVKSMESDGTVYQYEYPVAAEPLGEFQSRYYIPLGSNADQLFLSLVDRSGSVVIARRLKLAVSRDVPDLFVGVLSDEAWKLQYLDGIGVSYSTLRTRSFELTEEDFPEDEIGLSMLDVLVVNKFKLRRLSEQQTGAIMDWVHNGGVLILGTGMSVDDTLGRFAPELLDDSYGAPSVRHIDLGEAYMVDEPGSGMLAVPCVDVPLHGGNVIISSSGFPLMTAAAKQSGLIAVTAFDMGDISSFCEANNGYVDFMLTSLLGESRINRLAEVVYSGNSSKFWSVQSLINTGDVDKLPNLMVYVVVILVYLLILGPGLYVFLRSRELQMYYRKGVVMLSLAFAALIYVMGTTTRFKSTFYTYATIQDVSDEYVMDTTYLNIRNPYNRPYEVALNPEYTILPITRSYLYETSEVPVFTGDEPYQIAISRSEEEMTVRGQNIVSFAPRYFRLERKSDNTEKVGITGEVDYFEGKISGTITNQFPFPLEKATLLLYGNMVQLDRMEPGETKNLEDFELLRYPLGSSYVVADRITGQGTYSNKNINDRDFLLAMERSNMLNFYMDNYMSGYTADGRVIAFSMEKEESQFLQSPSAETYGLTMLTSSVAVNASQDSFLYRSVLMKEPTVVSGSYDLTTNSMSGTEPLTLEYQLGSDITVESLTFEPVSEEFAETSQSGYIEAFTGNIYFYNYRTGNYDKMELADQTLKLEELRPYLSPGNTLTVRYVYDGTGSYNAIQLPMPMAAGRER